MRGVKGPSWADATEEEELAEQQQQQQQSSQSQSQSQSRPQQQQQSQSQQSKPQSSHLPAPVSTRGNAPSSSPSSSPYASASPLSSDNSNSRRSNNSNNNSNSDRNEYDRGMGGRSNQQSRPIYQSNNNSSSNYPSSAGSRDRDRDHRDNRRDGGGSSSQRMSLDAREARAEQERREQRGGGGGYQRDSRDHRDSRDSRDSRDNQSWPRGEQPSGRVSDRHNDRGGNNSRGGLKPSESLSNERETGIVATLKEGFAFLKCVDREGELFMHFSDCPPGAQPKRGDECSFRVATDSRDGRARAVQVEFLPKGSVVFEQTLAEGVEGIVVKEMMGQVREQRGQRGRKVSLADSLAQGRAEAYGGKIKRSNDASSSSSSSTPSSGEELYEFSERDLTDANILLFAGDRVKFNVFLEKKSKRKGATKVTMIEPNPVGRERGRIVSIKEGFGFVALEENFDEDDEPSSSSSSSSSRFDRRDNQKDQVFFHFSELLDSNYSPAIGDELSFKIERSPAESNKMSAQRIVQLPKGSLNFREIGKETLQGIIVQEITYEQPEGSPGASPLASPVASPNPDASPEPSPSPVASPEPVSSPISTSSNRAAKPKPIPGVLRYTDNTGASVEIPFRLSDTPQDRKGALPLFKGDQVSFHLLTINCKSKATKRATQITLPASGWTKEGREQGVVSIVKEGFAFVDSVSRSEKLFLHASQLRGGDAAAHRADERGGREREKSEKSLYAGLEVEFNVIQDAPGRFSAVRAVGLLPGTVQFEETLPMTFDGKVSRSIKVRELKKSAAAKAGSDASSYSKNDLRRDQAQASKPAVETNSRGEGKGEKGEVKSISLAADSVPLPQDFQLPSSLTFFDIDVVDPDVASGLDRTSLIVGDTIHFQLKRHKQTKRLTATKIQLKAQSTENREKGQVCRLKEAIGTGLMLTTSRQQPLVFYLKDAPNVKVGDCFEFNISEANAGSKREREAKAKDDREEARTHAVRMASLPAGSVEIEKIDRTTRLRGFIQTVPDRPGSGHRGAGKKKEGTLVLITPGTYLQAQQHVSSTLASILTNPGSWGVDPASAPTEYNAATLHPAAFNLEGKAKKEPEEKYPFTFADISSSVFLSKGDLLDFYPCVRTQPAVSRRAVECTLVPIIGIVERIDAVPDKSNSAEQKNDGAPRAYTGLISVSNPQAPNSDESFYFVSKDVIAPNPSPSSSPVGGEAANPSPTPSEPFQLNVGDQVEFTDAVLNSDKKKRQARGITRIKESRGSAVRPGTKRAPGAAIVYASRFARGPDKEGIGFANRRKSAAPDAAAVTVGASSVPVSSPSPQ